MYELVMLANTVAWIALVIIFLRRPDASIYHPLTFYLAFHFLVFVLRAPLVYYRDYDYIYIAFDFQPTIEHKTTALLVALLGLLSFAAASLYLTRTPVRFEQRPEAEAERSRMLMPVLLTAAILAPVAIYSMLESWASDIAGISSMIMDSRTGIVVNSSSNGYLYESRMMLGPIAVMFAYVTRFRWYSFLPIVFFIVIGGGTGTRGPFILAAIALGILWLYDRRQRWPRASIVALAGALLLVFNTVGADRGAGIRGAFVQNQAEAGGFALQEPRFLEGMDAGNLEFLEFLTFAIPEKTGTYDYFTGLLQVFTEPIPRALWPGKPIGAPIKMFYLFDYGSPVGMTSSLPGWGWMNLGYIGVLIWCGLFGALWGLAYEKFASNRPTNVGLLAYVIFLPLSILFYRNGSPLTILRFGMFLAIPLVFLLIILRSIGGPQRAVEWGGRSGETPAERRARLAQRMRAYPPSGTGV